MNASYREIVAAELAANNIELCTGCCNTSSHSRGFAEADKRVIHFNAKMATRGTLYGFLHEVGHIAKAHGKSSKLRRYEREQEAEDYARESFRQLGLAVPRKQVVLGNAYVARFKRFGDNVRRGLARSRA